MRRDDIVSGTVLFLGLAFVGSVLWGFFIAGPTAHNNRTERAHSLCLSEGNSAFECYKETGILPEEK